MIKKLMTYGWIIILGFIFILISILVFITNGNKKLIKYKLKTGAMLITFIGALNIISISCEPPITCYVPLTTSIEINEASDRIINLECSDSIILNGKIYYSSKSNYSFKILDSNDNEVFSHNLTALDGSFGEEKEKFIINIDINLPPGEYKLNFYNVKISEIKDNNYYIQQYTLNIITKE